MAVRNGAQDERSGDSSGRSQGRADSEVRKARRAAAAAISNAPIRGWLVRRLRSLIANGIYRPGDRMIERELCERTKVSRPSLREALRQLEAEGLVDILPFRGPVVRMVTEADVVELRETGLALSTLIARRFALHGTSRQIDELEAAIHDFDSALHSRDRGAIKTAKSALFEAFAAGANSEVATSYFQQVNARLSFLWSASLDIPGRPKESVGELLSLLSAIRIHNADAAEAAVILHHEHGDAIAMHALRVFEATKGKQRAGTRVRAGAVK